MLTINSVGRFQECTFKDGGREIFPSGSSKNVCRQKQTWQMFSPEAQWTKTINIMSKLFSDVKGISSKLCILQYNVQYILLIENKLIIYLSFNRLFSSFTLLSFLFVFPSSAPLLESHFSLLTSASFHSGQMENLHLHAPPRLSEEAATRDAALKRWGHVAIHFICSSLLSIFSSRISQLSTRDSV